MTGMETTPIARAAMGELRILSRRVPKNDQSGHLAVEALKEALLKLAQYEGVAAFRAEVADGEDERRG